MVEKGKGTTPLSFILFSFVALARSNSKEHSKDSKPLASHFRCTGGRGEGIHNQVTQETSGFYNEEEEIFSSSSGDEASNVNNIVG